MKADAPGEQKSLRVNRSSALPVSEHCMGSVKALLRVAVFGKKRKK